MSRVLYPRGKAPGTHCTGDLGARLDGCGEVCSSVLGREMPGCEADQHHTAEERSPQLHSSDTPINSHLAVLVCAHVRSADETGSVTRG
jgi:hypothetical protein